MYEYNGLKINYIDINKSAKKVIVALHGWGQNIEMMELLCKYFYDDYRVIIMDLPGHGESSELSYAYTLDEFVIMIRAFLKNLKVSNPIMIGHSFGGKLSLLYASRYDVKKLVLLASPYKKSTKKPSLKIRVLKKLKFIPGMNGVLNYFRKNSGSLDYNNATPVMREVIVKHVNTDVCEDAKKIKCPTLIVWGDKDDAVNVNDAYELEKLIRDSGVVVYKNSTHYAYLENKVNLIKVLNVFFKE